MNKKELRELIEIECKKHRPFCNSNGICVYYDKTGKCLGMGTS